MIYYDIAEWTISLQLKAQSRDCKEPESLRSESVRPSRSPYRPDIDGLRAVAVLAAAWHKQKHNFGSRMLVRMVELVVSRSCCSAFSGVH